jgi:biofilm protein TabA
MILDSLEQVRHYAALGPTFARAFDYLATADLETLGDGRHPIDGEAVYALVSSYRTEAPAAKKLEAHRRYADIQVLLQGEETILWRPLEGLQAEAEYQADKDIIFFREPVALEPAQAVPGSAPLHLRPGLFALFLPSDAHAPGCRLRDSQAVRKLVVKVRV